MDVMITEMTVFELYMLVLTACLVSHFGVWCRRHFETLETNGERLVMIGGMFALFGLPAMITFSTILL